MRVPLFPLFKVCIFICNKKLLMSMSNAHSSHRIFHVKAFYQTTRSLVCATYLSLWFAAIRPFKCPIKLFFFINFSQVQVSLRPMITDMRAELGFLIMLWHKNIQSENITQKSWRITSLQSPLADQRLRPILGPRSSLSLPSGQDESFPNFSCLLQHWDLI